MNIIPKNIKDLFMRSSSTIVGLGLLLCGIYGLFSIVSYSASDMSLNTVNNSVFSFGSYLADFVLQVFGLAGIFILISFVAWGYKILRFKSLYNLKMRIVFLSVFTIIFSTGLSPFDYMLTISSTMDGIIGRYLGHLTIINFGDSAWYVGLILIFISIPMLLYSIAIRGSELKQGFKHSQAGFSKFIDINKKIYGFANRKNKASEELLNLPQQSLEQDGYFEQEEETLFEPKRKPLKTKANPRKKAVRPKSNRFELPKTDLLVVANDKKIEVDAEAQEFASQQLQSTLLEFGVKGQITGVINGPVVTTYEFEPEAGVRASRVISLDDDIARTMGAQSVRIAQIPGKKVINIEMPNVTRETVNYREILENKKFKSNDMLLPLVLGKSLEGDVTVADLAKMPHLLIAGTTGSGKSVGLNAMILSLLFKYTPEELKMIMIDPKMLEFAMYEDIPHLISPVVTDPKKAIVALKWAVQEMNSRYSNMAKMSVRNIEGYNQKVETILKTGEVITETVQTGFDGEGKPIFEERQRDIKKYPYLVIIVDEMADLMLVAGKEIESSIQSLAQKARAAGIHIIMATQRPSVDVITGIIKANFPTRISYMVTSKIDSRTIINEGGAEQLLGRGDMLYMAGGLRPTRHHAPFVQDNEVQSVCDWLRAQAKPEYIDAVTEDAELTQELAIATGEAKAPSKNDEMFDEAVALVAKTRKASTSYIQRALGIGYNRAAKIIEQMEAEGMISPATKTGKRDVNLPETDY